MFVQNMVYINVMLFIVLDESVINDGVVWVEGKMIKYVGFVVGMFEMLFDI